MKNKLYLVDFSLIFRKPVLILRGLTRYAQNRFSKGHFLTAVSFAATYDCNFNCSHCYAQNFRKNDRRPMSLEEKKSAIRECVDLGAIAFDFVGGEVSQSQELEQLVRECNPGKTYISLTTNGYDIDRQKLKLFRRWGIDKLCVSIDSWDEAEHDRFRNKPGSHRKCFQTLQLCREVGIKPVMIMTVSRGFTKKDGFKNMVDFAVRNRIQLVFSIAIPFGKWENDFDVLATREDLDEIRRLTGLHPALLTRDNISNMGRAGCPAFKQFIYITEYGDVLPCAFTHIAFGNLRDESLSSIRKRALKLDYFGLYHQSCLAGEDTEFIKKYLSKNYSAKVYPARAEEVFGDMINTSYGKVAKRNIKKASVKCAICGNDNHEVIARGREHEFEDTTDDIFFVVKCGNCGLVYLNPRPDISEFDTVYPETYYCHNNNTLSLVSKKSPVVLLKERLIDTLGFPMTIRRLLKKYHVDGQISVLDAGCGTGAALDIFKKAGNGRIHTFGIDFDEIAVRWAHDKGHMAQKGLFEESEFPSGSFDIVYSANVIEHVADPALFMAKVSDILKPRGLFICETPNADSVEARFFRGSGYWGGYHFPRHWTFFTPRHIKKLGEKFGLNMINIEYLPSPIFWIWTFHSMLFNIGKNKRMADTFFPLLEDRNNYLYSLLLKINFTVWDYSIKLLTGRTASMCAIFRKEEIQTTGLS